MKNLYVLALLFISTFAFSQTSNTTPQAFIEVTGTAKREIVPNQIYISITLSEKSIDNRKYNIETQELKLYQILRELNVPESKLTLTDFTSYVISDRRKEIGFKQNKQFTLLLENAQQVSVLFDKLFEANIKEADVTKMDHTDIVNYNKEVRIEALKAAKAKAEYLLLAVGNKLGKPLEIIEETQDSRNYSANKGLNSYTPSTSNTSNEFKKIAISFSYHVKYSIE